MSFMLGKNCISVPYKANMLVTLQCSFYRLLFDLELQSVSRTIVYFHVITRKGKTLNILAEDCWTDFPVILL